MRYLIGLFLVLVFVFGSQRAYAAAPEKKLYVRISKGCVVVYNKYCAVARYGAGDKFGIWRKLRVDSFFRVREAVKGKDDRLWYKIVIGTGPGKKYVSDKYVLADYTEIIDVPDVIPRALPGEPEKIIEVDISEQRTRAYEGDKLVLVMETPVSTGAIGLATPLGKFRILSYKPTSYMWGPDFDLPGVSFVLCFTRKCASFHGTYWHNKYGTRQSHGCVNMPFDKALWLYKWVNLDVKIIVKR